MTILKKFSGNYIEVIDQLGLPPGFYDSQTPKKYLAQINNDLDRTTYLSLSNSGKEMQQLISNDAQSLVGEGGGPTLSYTQGDWDGRVTFFSVLQKSVEAQQRGEELKDNPNFFTDNLAFAYRDDKGKPCGLALCYFREDADDNIPLEEQKYSFFLSFIRNTTSAPENREVVIITHPSLMSKDEKSEGEDIADKDIPAELTRLINSKNVTAILEGLFNGDSLSIKHFMELQNRIGAHNIDNRDYKKPLLEEAIKIVREKHANNAAQQQYLDTVEQHALTDINFFRENTSGEIRRPFQASRSSSELSQALQEVKNNKLHELHNRYELDKAGYAKPVPPLKEGQNFFQRNRTPIIIGVVSLLAALSLVLMLTGILAPVGVALAATTILGAAGAVGVILAGSTIARNERLFSKQSNDYANDNKQYQLETGFLDMKLKQNQEILESRIAQIFDKIQALDDDKEEKNPLLKELEATVAEGKRAANAGLAKAAASNLSAERNHSLKQPSTPITPADDDEETDILTPKL